MERKQTNPPTKFAVVSTCNDCAQHVLKNNTEMLICEDFDEPPFQLYHCNHTFVMKSMFNRSWTMIEKGSEDSADQKTDCHL